MKNKIINIHEAVKSAVKEEEKQNNEKLYFPELGDYAWSLAMSIAQIPTHDQEQFVDEVTELTQKYKKTNTETVFPYRTEVDGIEEYSILEAVDLNDAMIELNGLNAKLYQTEMSLEKMTKVMSEGRAKEIFDSCERAGEVAIYT